MKKVTVIIPVFNEGEILKDTTIEIKKILDNISTIQYELLFVDDGSQDNTYKILEEISLTDSKVSFISFSKNFGKEAAILAGLENAKSDGVIIIDADLQHPPELIPEMIELWQKENYDVIDGIKASRGKENPFYKLSSLLFNFLMNKLTGLNLKGSSDFKLLDKKVVDEILRCSERTRFFRGLTEWVGFKHKKIFFNVNQRKGGKTKWSLTKLIKYSLNNIIAFSSVPLKLISLLGFFVIFIAIGLIIQTLYLKFTYNAVEGFTTVIISVSFFSGIILLSLGVIGEYLSKIYEEIKARPSYILKRKKEEKRDKSDENFNN